MSLFPGFRKTNNRAIAGFILPFSAAGTACAVVLYNRNHELGFPLWAPFVSLIPFLLIVGLIFSIRSFRYIETLGDKDYAYSGLVLNLFFILLYIGSLLYLLL
jgi:hypothetical protein